MSRRPNRGGGRGNRPPPQRGHHHGQSSGQGNLSRKGASAIDIDEDLAMLLEEGSLEEESDDDEWVMDDEVVEEPGSKDPAKPPERRKVEMQILHMSDQSQQMVIQMLKELHGSQYKMRDPSAYKDAGQR